MKKRKKKNKTVSIQRRMSKFFIFIIVILLIGVVYSRATLAKIDLEAQSIEEDIKEVAEDNQSLVMRINEMVSLEKIQEICDKLGLKFNKENIVSVE